jgi:pyruvate dehydrogenase E2 component (dihydrolipoamide acetyltransferase)
MAIEITIPRLGWNMEEGTFIGWLKQDGDTIRAGDALFSLEGEKATEDIECLDSGILRIPTTAPKPGEKVAVGTVIGFLVSQGESVGWVESSRPTAMPKPSQPEARAREQTVGLEDSTHPTPSTHPSAPSAGSPSARRLARKLGVLVEARPVVATPRARRAARELGIDWRKLKGSGRTGRIRERDVRAAAGGTKYTKTGNQSIIPLTPIRQTIAARLLTSAHSTAPLTLTTTADATNLVNFRNQFKSSAEPAPSYTDILAKLTAAALGKHPLLNSSWADDHIVVNKDVHIGIAVDTDAGLLVPVLRDVPNLGLRQLAAAAREMIERARSDRLKAEEMQGGTFTITNLGNFGIDAFTPIINPPQCAILGVGRIHRQPVVSGDAVVIRDMVTLCLTFDHRIVDGAPAARFLQTLVHHIENPAPALVL